MNLLNEDLREKREDELGRSRHFTQKWFDTSFCVSAPMKSRGHDGEMNFCEVNAWGRGRCSRMACGWFAVIRFGDAEMELEGS